MSLGFPTTAGMVSVIAVRHVRELTVVAKRAISRDVDTFLFTECEKVVLRQQWVGLDLVDGLGEMNDISHESRVTPK